MQRVPANTKVGRTAARQLMTDAAQLGENCLQTSDPRRKPGRRELQPITHPLAHSGDCTATNDVDK